MYNFNFCKISPSYFQAFPELVREADLKETRLYFGVCININDNNCFIPFESNLHDHPYLRQHSQYLLPSSTRPNGGLNLEKCLIINELQYVIPVPDPQIASSQYKKLIAEQEIVRNKLELYINKFVKACEKKREDKEYIFKFSTVHQFKEELGLIPLSSPL